MTPLFVYGSLRDADVLLLVLGRLPGVRTLAMAPGCRAVTQAGRSYPGLRRDGAATAPGLLLGGLSEADLARLDDFEGDEYSRGPIEIIVNGQPLAADVYWPVLPVPAEAPDWILADWTLRHKAAFLVAEADAIAHARRRPAPPPG